jgi:hypothetical protein
MRSEVAGIEEALATHLDQQHVRIECRMVDQERRDGKRPDLERRTALPWGERVRQPRPENGGAEADQPRGGLAEYIGQPDGTSSKSP